MKRTIALLALSTSVIALSGFTGCQNQQQTAASLVSTLGTEVANLGAIEGKSPELVAKIKADTAAAASQIAGFQSGSASQDVIAALALVEDDLNLFPIDAQDQALVDLGIATVQSIIAVLPVTLGPGSPGVSAHAMARRALVAHRLPVNSVPATSAKDFKAKWDALLATKPALAAATAK